MSINFIPVRAIPIASTEHDELFRCVKCGKVFEQYDLVFNNPHEWCCPKCSFLKDENDI